MGQRVFSVVVAEAGGQAQARQAIAAALPPRMKETLSYLVNSAYGEKQIAHELGLSHHTVHVYVKGLYRRFGVCSRAELFVAVFNQLQQPLNNTRNSSH